MMKITGIIKSILKGVILSTKTVLVMGASGMLGNAFMRFFTESPSYLVWGSARSGEFLKHMPTELHSRIVTGVNVDSPDSLHQLFDQTRPDFVINCIGLVKQHLGATDPLSIIPINSILPHRLARLCKLSGARLIHISTDCVFSGSKGNYLEEDYPDSNDLYGRSKLMGEVDYQNAVTLRTSVIGHELIGAKSLINWFLSQKKEVEGYVNARFSGMPTVELAKVVRDFVIPRPELHGLYHVSTEPICKHDLLQFVAQVYDSKITIKKTLLPVIDRSLDSRRFREATGYMPPDWLSLVRSMYQFR